MKSLAKKFVESIDTLINHTYQKSSKPLIDKNDEIVAIRDLLDNYGLCPGDCLTLLDGSMVEFLADGTTLIAHKKKNKTKIRYKKGNKGDPLLSIVVQAKNAKSNHYYQKVNYLKEPQRRAILHCTAENFYDTSYPHFINAYSGRKASVKPDELLYELHSKRVFTRTTLDGEPSNLQKQK